MITQRIIRRLRTYARELYGPLLFVGMLTAFGISGIAQEAAKPTQDHPATPPAEKSVNPNSDDSGAPSAQDPANSQEHATTAAPDSASPTTPDSVDAPPQNGTAPDPDASLPDASIPMEDSSSPSTSDRDSTTADPSTAPDGTEAGKDPANPTSAAPRATTPSTAVEDNPNKKNSDQTASQAGQPSKPAVQDEKSTSQAGAEKPSNPAHDTGPKDAATLKAEERQAKIVSDTKKLYDMVQDLKAEVAKSNKDTLSLSVVKKAAEIEKLAKSLKEQMRTE